MKKTALLLSLLIFINLQIFAEIKLISPVAGTWANKQMLIIDNPSDGDYFYSIDGSDPETFGFAYDGPAIIDVTDQVKLRITHVTEDFNRESTEVCYTVNEDEALLNSYGEFISSFYDTGLINYSAGTILSIPEDLYCSIGLAPEAFFPGRDLSLSPDCILTEFIPFTLLNPETNEKWRFIVRTFPQSAGVFSRRDVPFTITDWNTINFVNQDLIYKIDSDFWELPKESKYIDRSVSHMISWQSLNYEQGNTVEFFILPPKPELKSQQQEDGSVKFYLEGDDSYTISVLNNANKDYEELFTEIGADVFYGDKVDGTLNLGIFASSVYQGHINAEYHINKRPPENPEIVSDAAGFYSRKPVEIKISCDSENKSDLYVSVSEPLLLSDVSNTLNPDNPVFEDVKENEFEKIQGTDFSTVLKSKEEGAVYYRIKAYSQSGDKKSFVSEYSVIVDQYNYYFDASAVSEMEDGTAVHPYSSFEKCLNEINKCRNVCLNVKGKLLVPAGSNQLLANTELKTAENGEIIFDAGASLVIKNASLSIQNCSISNNTSEDYANTIPMFKLESSVLTLKNCICSGSFSKNGNIFECSNSVLNISDSVISSLSKVFVSCITSVASKLNLQNSTFTSSADTCVILSEHEGSLLSTGNSLKVLGKNGRIAELFGVDAVIEDCQYKAELLRNNVSVNPVYKNSKTTLQESNNVSTGF